MPQGGRSESSRLDLSLGQVLLFQDALLAYEQGAEAEERKKLADARRSIAEVLNRWAAAAGRKANSELPQRLHLWQAFLIDTREEPSSAAEYPAQVRTRVIAERLLSLVGNAMPAERQRLQALDSALKAVFAAGPFLWEEPLSRVYDRATFWYLYGRLRPQPD